MTQTLVTTVDQQFTTDQLNLIRQTVAKGTTPEQFKLFVEVCKYHGLNPFARQIYAVVRNSKDSNGNYQPQMTIQTSIDGYRLIAERSGKYGGQIGPEWCGDDGKWCDVWLADKPPAAARIGVIRKDFQQPTWGVAKYKSYAQSSPLWQKMPDVMLAKCAESLALRKAFPAEMSGIYTREEMEQAIHDDAPDMSIVEGTVVEDNARSNGGVANPPARPTPAPAQKPVQPAPTQSQETSKTEPTPLNAIPSKGQLKRTLDAGKFVDDAGNAVDWDKFIELAFSQKISKDKSAHQKLLDVDWGPNYCEHAAKFLATLKRAA